MTFRTFPGRLSYFFAASIILLLSGCASLEKLLGAADVREPEVSLAGTQLSALSFDGAELTMLINVDNPNALPIKLAGFDYALNIDGKPFTQGEQHSGINIDARSSNQVEVPIAFKFTELVNLFKGEGNRDSLPFNIDSKIRVDLPVLGTRTIPASYSNAIPIPSVPSMQVSDVAIDSLSLTGAALTVVMAMDNPNAFGIDLTRLDYNLLVNGKSWAAIKTANVVTLPEKGHAQMSIPVSLSFSDMGMALYQALTQSKAMEYQLNGDMTLDTTLPLLKNIELPLKQAGAFQAR